MDWKTRIIKRTIDVAVASAGLALTAPLFPVIAAAVKLTSDGPIFYKQTRCGVERRSGIAGSRPPVAERRRRNRNLHTFEMLKFRTMRVDAEARTGAVLAQKNDPRLTVIGGLLRKTRLDELPQLVHVLVGDMSIVGPRPERPELMVKLSEAIPFFEERMRLIKPGITGLAQIKLNYDGSFSASPESKALEQFLQGIELPQEALNGANDTRAFANKLLYDLAYGAILENPLECLKTDLEIMVKTPLVMLRGSGQ
ncbi:MAG: sugar transferase [Deltaproteobacteria bacterium]|nr:sugar transferase [Deltaproteobacteria bacterium]